MNACHGCYWYDPPPAPPCALREKLGYDTTPGAAACRFRQAREALGDPWAVVTGAERLASMNPAEILEACHHADASSEVDMGDGRTLHVCCDCWNASVYRRRELRKQELAELAKREPCQKCGRHRANWIACHRFHICGRCKRELEREAYRVAASSPLGIFTPAYTPDTRTWAYPTLEEWPGKVTT